MLPYPLDLVEKLAISTDSRILLIVLDGVGDVAAEGKTPLAAASTPHLDELARGGSLGLSTPVAPGIAPGSGPGHLSLFGYDPLVYEVGLTENGDLVCLLMAGAYGWDISHHDFLCHAHPERIYLNEAGA